MVPGNVALTLFAVASGDKAALRSKVRVGPADLPRWSACPVSLVVAVFANPIMSIFGAGYAAVGRHRAEHPGPDLHPVRLPPLLPGDLPGAGQGPRRRHLLGLRRPRRAGRRLVRRQPRQPHRTGRLGRRRDGRGDRLVAPTVLRVVLPSRRSAVTETPEGTMSTTSLTLHERAWLPLEYIRTVGPLTGVTAERMRDALIGLHAADPTHRAVSRLDRAGARWLHMDAPTFAAYVAGGGHRRRRRTGRLRRDDPAAAGRAARAPPGADPGRRRLRRDEGGARVRRRRTGERPAAGAGPGGRRRAGRADRADASASFALPRAWWKQFGKSPARWRDALRMARTPHAEAGETRPWLPNLTVRTARSADVLGKHAGLARRVRARA